MKRFLLITIGSLLIPFFANGEHLSDQKELVITTESSRYSISLAKHLTKKGVVKYSAYWCPNCYDQAKLFGKQAYKEQCY